MAADSQVAVSADMYLTVRTKRAGPVKGDSITPGHIDDIVLTGWHWGADTDVVSASTNATGRRRLKQLTVRKTIDGASTSLAMAMGTNDQVKEATLAMRKSGGAGAGGDYFTMKLTNGRITSIDFQCDVHGDVVEVLTFAFDTLELNYRKFLGSGLLGAGSSATFETLAI